MRAPDKEVVRRQLPVLVACLALSAYAASRLLDQLPVLTRITIWFVGVAVVWDLLLGPLVALADRGLRPLHRVRLRGVAALNYVRVPAAFSALLLLVWAPLVFERSAPVYENKSGLDASVYLGRWASVALALAVLSAVAYAVAVLRSERSERSERVAH